ncbi:hypothetical protein M6B38_139840 [Iris pallida]|uniref:Uncharacterized protein n=1 Tax=Iris pallida TaxID=29817 RepID=A0AAX6FEL4_IRIPA|nr:hypothetical protein M6B38_139840 [Iris pallida]
MNSAGSPGATPNHCLIAPLRSTTSPSELCATTRSLTLPANDATGTSSPMRCTAMSPDQTLTSTSAPKPTMPPRVRI